MGLARGTQPSAEAWAGFLDSQRETLEAEARSKALLEHSLRIASEEMRELITDQKRLSASELAVERDRLEAVISSHPDGLVIVDTSHQVVFANAEAHRLLGLPARELFGKPLSTALPLDHGAGCVKLSHVVEREEHVRLVRAGWGSFPAAYTSAPIHGSDAGWMMSFRDTTVWTDAQAALRGERDYTKALIDALEDGLTVLSPTGVTVDANRRFLEMTGFARHEIIGAGPPLPYLPGVDASRISHTLSTIREVGAREMELEYTRRDGSTFPVIVTGAPVHDSEGQVLAFVATVKDITDRKRAEAQLIELASTDGLTGLANHRTFQERLTHEIRRSKHSGRPLCVIMIDIDHFKRVNDVHGHGVGDAVLRQIGKSIVHQAREHDLVARIGGEEFGWIVPGASRADAMDLAERARRAVESTEFGGVGRITVSIGMSQRETIDDQDPGHRLEYGDLMQAADTALYWSKSHGRNRVSLHTAVLADAAQDDSFGNQLERAERLGAIRALASAVDARDHSTHYHSERVAAFAGQLADELGWTPSEVARLREAGLVHDVGKLCLPDSILLKPGRLDPLEYEQVKTHAAVGAQIVTGTLLNQQVAWVRGHHERFDGRGYPDGLVGSDIPEGASILALADAWDAMTYSRLYNSPRLPAEAFAECQRESGRQFCPTVVRALEALYDRNELRVPPLDRKQLVLELVGPRAPSDPSDFR